MTERYFIPGGPWVYFKLYSGHRAADNMLTSAVRDLVRRLKEEQLIEDFFFIRYADPKHHLRLRFLMVDVRRYGQLFLLFHEIFRPIFDAGFINRVQCDTYKRELERYGTDSIVSAERFFSVDSFYILELLHHLHNYSDNKEQERWLLSLNLIDDILNVFNYNIGAKTAIAKDIADNFKKEFGFLHRNYTKQLNDKYRDLKVHIPKSLVPLNAHEKLLFERKIHLQPIADKLLQFEADNMLQVPLQNIIISFIHMTMNRWFPSKNRLYEMVIYDFLMRSYNQSAFFQKSIQHGKTNI